MKEFGMVKSEYPDEEEFSTSDGSIEKSIEEDEGIEGLEGWRTVSIREYKTTNASRASRVSDGGRGNYRDVLVIDSVVGKECGLHSCTSTSSSNDSSLLLNSSRTANHDQIIHGDSMEDKRLRRQIANSNERRRMQSINQGFIALRQMLPNKKDGDKMSKAAILSATAEFIQGLQMEKVRLEEILEQEESEQAAQAKRQRLDCQHDELMEVAENSPIRTAVPSSLQSSILECLRTIDELRTSLVKEQQLRLLLEQEVLALRKNSNCQPPGMEQSPLLAVCPQQRLATNQPVLFNIPPVGMNGYSAGRRVATPQETFPQNSSLIASALTSAFCTLRDVFGSTKLAEVGAGNECPTPIPQHATLNSNFQLQSPQEQSHPVGAYISLDSMAAIANEHSSEMRNEQLNPSAFKQTAYHSDGAASTLMHHEKNGSAGTSLSQRNLQAILEAIRHIEGGEPTKQKN